MDVDEKFKNDALLNQEPPKDPMKRIHFFAKVLAHGVVQGYWAPSFYVIFQDSNREEWGIAGLGEQARRFQDYIKKMWSAAGIRENSISFIHPQISCLRSFLYMELEPRPPTKSGRRNYILTPKAYDLLIEPAVAPDVFISYRRNCSSALGLLVVARLQLRGSKNIFIDLDIKPGDEWHTRLEQKVKDCTYFVVLLARDTFREPGSNETDYVLREIKWALDAKVTILPIWHSGFTGEYPKEIFGVLEKTHAIIVENENAKQYNLAIVDLLNGLGYAPQ